MLCAALLNLNLVPHIVIERALASLHLGADENQWYADVVSTSRSGVVAPQFRVIEAEIASPRDYRDIKNILRAARDAHGITQGAYDKASRAFELLARAEAAVHNVHVDDVHFHEVRRSTREHYHALYYG